MGWIDYELSAWQWILLGVCGVLVGLSKTGLPGVGILGVPLMALILPARQSVGVLLPMLIFADLFSASYYRHHAQWRHLLRLLPAAFAGILAGYLLLGRVSDRQLEPIIGIIVLVMLALKGRTMFGSRPGAERVPAGRWFGWLMGFAAGVTTMMANAAGPVMVLYLLAMGMEKRKFVGTAAWFFFVVNWVKVPFSAGLGLITPASLKLDALTFPAVALGAMAGIFLLKVIPQTLFNLLALLLASAAAVTLLL